VHCIHKTKINKEIKLIGIKNVILLYLIKKLKAMLRFLKSVFKSVLVTFISFIIIVGVFVVIGLSASMEEEEKTKSNSLLEIIYQKILLTDHLNFFRLW